MDFKGLSNGEAAESRIKFGANSITQHKRKTFLKQYLSCFSDPIIRILLIALFFNIVFMMGRASIFETFGIAVVIILSTVVSTISEFSSEAAFARIMQEAGQASARVYRSGALCEIAAADVVVGDLVKLASGERVPADGEILHGAISVDQSALNGESKEASKAPLENKDLAAEESFMARNKVFRGTLVMSGEAVMRVHAVGDKTHYGIAAADLSGETGQSPLKLRLSGLAKFISIIGYIMAAVVILANLFNDFFLDNSFNPAEIAAYFKDVRLVLSDILHSVTLGITVVVMAVPEGLPMMITVVLSSNMRRMMKGNVLVRKLVGIETSGSLNILFTDKTGTLTKGRLEAVSFMDGAGCKLWGNVFKASPLFKHVVLNCYYNNGADISNAGKAVGGNATDRALLELVAGEKIEKQNFRIVAPFSSENKFSAAEIWGASSDKRTTLIKGAPDILIDKCKFFYDANGLKQEIRGTAALKNKLSEWAALGERLVLLCESEDSIAALAGAPLTLVGFIGIKDELRREAAAAIKSAVSAGVQVVMLTGDSLETAKAIGRSAGLIDYKTPEGAILTSAQLGSLTDAQIKKLLPLLRIVARSTPSDKSRLVRLAQEAGLVAGMTGDGVNDAPALKKADVGFAMGSGAEIAKEAGDIVILDNNISSITRAILYGRTIFKSIRKFIIFQLSFNLCAVAISVIGPLLGIDTPITVMQMLWINLIMDTMAGLAYAGEAPQQHYMLEKPKLKNEKIINKYMFNQILTTGIFCTILAIAFLFSPVIRGIFISEEHFTTGFFALFIFMGIFSGFCARTHSVNLFSHIEKNRAFISIFGFITAIQLIIIYIGGNIFKTSGLTMFELIFVVLLAATVPIVDVGRKLVLSRKHWEEYT